jgi:hypothetical protein
MMTDKPLWQRMQAELEKDVMAPPVGSIFGPEEYARAIQAVIDHLTERWRMGYDTSGAVHVLKKEKMAAIGDYNQFTLPTTDHG